MSGLLAIGRTLRYSPRDSAVTSALVAALARPDLSDEARLVAVDSLGWSDLRSADVRGLLRAALSDETATVRLAAAWGLLEGGQTPDPEIAKWLDRLGSDFAEIATASSGAAMRLDGASPQRIEVLRRALGDKDMRVRLAAVRAIRLTGSAAMPLVPELLKRVPIAPPGERAELDRAIEAVRR